MNVKIVNVSPSVAENYLKANTYNRRLDNAKVAFYATEMEKGEWKENGECLIFDTRGTLKDGQHRLAAIVRSGKTYKIPVVTGVDPDVMDTIDTGKNRSLADILNLNGFSRATATASLAIRLIKHIIYDSKALRSHSTKANRTGVSNTYALKFCFEHKEELLKLVRLADALNKQGRYRVISNSDVALLIFITGGWNYREVHINFMKHVLGIRHNDGNGASFLNRKLSNAKLNKTKLNTVWITAIYIKAYNLFIDGDAPIGYLKFDINDDEFPIIHTLPERYKEDNPNLFKDEEE